MRAITWLILTWLVAFGSLTSWQGTPAMAAVTAEQRKEIAEIKKEVNKAQGHIAKKEYEEARKILDEAREKLTKIAADAKVMETDRALAPVFLLMEKKRVIVDKKLGGTGEGAVDFEKTIAPLLAAKCAGCHNEDRSSGGLKLDTFAGLEEGGTNKPVLFPGRAGQSLLLARVTASGNGRMPKAPQPALSKEEIVSIASWVNQGAKFTGDKTKKFAAARPANSPSNNLPPPTIPRATGDEKVSFTKDIAPFMVNLCVGCHSGNNPRGGLSLVSFESMMRGGNSGRVVLPGNKDGSRLYRLVGGIENPRMPQGQGRITRKNLDDLITWFDEGNKFDGSDPKRPLREIVPTDAELAAARLSKLTDDEFRAMRKERSDEQWKLANPKEQATTLESADFLVMGNVSEPRLKEVLGWADEHAKTLRAAFGIKSPEIWRGRLTVFVYKDRFSFEEFPRVVGMNDAVPRELIGLSEVSPSLEDAYVCVEDVGDKVSAESPGLKLNLIDQITGAYLKRSGDKIPDWLIRGLGLALVAKTEKKNEFIQAQPTLAVAALQALESPDQVFEKGKFSSADTGPIGFTLVQHMLAVGGPVKMGQLIERMQGGADLPAALKGVYNVDLKTLGLSYLSTLGPRKPIKVKKK